MPYHVGIQSSHEFTGATGHQMNLIETIVEVTGLEVMRNSGNLDTSHIVHIGIDHGEGRNGVFQTSRLAVVEHDDSESVIGIVLVAGATNSVQNEIIFFSATSDKDINGWAVVVSDESHLGSVSLLHRPHGPGVVHQRGNGDHDLDGDEDPSSRIRRAVRILSPNDGCDTKTKVRQVQSSVSKGHERNKLVQVPLPSFPNVGVVARVHDLNGVTAIDSLFAVSLTTLR